MGFGAGDWRTRTEARPPPPPLALGDRLALGPLVATVDGLLGHQRLVALSFDGPADGVWAVGMAGAGILDPPGQGQPAAGPVAFLRGDIANAPALWRELDQAPGSPADLILATTGASLGG